MSRIWKTCNFLVFLGGAEGAKIFWGLPNGFSTNPEKIVKVRESAPSKIGFLWIEIEIIYFFWRLFQTAVMGVNLWDDIAINPFWCQITPLTKTRTEILKMLGLPISSSTWYGPISSSTWFGPKASSTCFGLAHIYRVHKKMVHSDFSLKSVPGVRFCFFRGGLEPELCAWTIWAL